MAVCAGHCSGRKQPHQNGSHNDSAQYQGLPRLDKILLFSVSQQSAAPAGLDLLAASSVNSRDSDPWLKSMIPIVIGVIGGVGLLLAVLHGDRGHDLGSSVSVAGRARLV